MSELQDIGLKHETDKATFHMYPDFYAQWLPDRSFTGRLLEIGILGGASMKMWHEYYPKAEIVGIDIVKQEKQIAGVTMLEIDGTKPDQLEPLGMFDVIIDDGSHYTADQQASFNHLFYNQLNEGGIYAIEDLHSSLLPQYINSPIDTIEFLHQLDKRVIYFRRNADEVDSMTCIIKND